MSESFENDCKLRCLPPVRFASRSMLVLLQTQTQAQTHAQVHVQHGREVMGAGMRGDNVATTARRRGAGATSRQGLRVYREQCYLGLLPG